MKKRMFSKFSSILQHAVDAVSVLLAGICANVSHPGGFVSGFYSSILPLRLNMIRMRKSCINSAFADMCWTGSELSLGVDSSG